MIRPVQMCKIRAICLQRDQKKAITVMHDYGSLQIEDAKIREIEKISVVHGLEETIQNKLRLESIQRQLGIQEEGTGVEEKSALKKREFSALEKQVFGIAREISEAKQREQELLAELERTRMFRKFDLDFSLLEIEGIALIAGAIETQKIAIARSELAHSVKHFSLLQKELEKNTLLVIVGLKAENRQTGLQALQKFGFRETELPKAKGKPLQASKRIEAELGKLLQKTGRLEREKNRIAQGFGKKIGASLAALKIEADRKEIAKNFGKTEKCFAFEAFLPEKKFAEAKELLESKLNGKILIEKVSFCELENKHENVPVLLDNPRQLHSFEFVVGFMSLPKSFELDPTLVFAFFFPVFYGMMLGDAGYGLISLCIAWFLGKKFKKSEIMLNVSRLWMLTAITTILFGIVFDEYFGFTHHELLEKIGVEAELYHGLERLQEIEKLLPLTIITGVASIAFGFLLGIVNAVIEKNRKHAIAKAAWFFTVLSGTVAISGFMFGLFSETISMASGIVLLAGIAGIIMTEGAVGVIELPSVAGNILSFARILAVGLASVVVAVIINDLLAPKPEHGLLLVVIVPLFVALHALNAFIGMFEGLVQGARLNFVELFSKFFEGGGKQFIPFSIHNTLNKKKEV